MLEEGKHLSRFVSDSTQKAVQETTGSGSPDEPKWSVADGTVLVLGVANLDRYYSGMSEKDVIAYLCDLIKLMISPVSKNQGMIDNLLGDEIFSIFHGQEPEGCFLAIQEVFSQLKVFNEERKTDFSFCAGVSSGMVHSGIIGESSIRISFTCIGPNVNRAFRFKRFLEKSSGSGILVSETFLKGLPGEKRSLFKDFTSPGLSEKAWVWIP
ncbi:MAG: adenylate/guanylate cyclase domain-containing protein [Candidatus Riflebacteria bacterium]|nr:adenylate/guanylate cyclase domain-containing protein [Candidatus Riflebacteria bacterium]